MATSSVMIDPTTGERIQGGAPQIDPATGERVSTRASSPDFSNKAGQGTYNMWDTAGKMHPVPYSLVPVLHGQGYKFDTNADQGGLTPAERFQKDQGADPNAPHGPGALDPRGGWNPADVARGAVAGVKNMVAHPIQTAESMGAPFVAAGVAPGGMYPTSAATGRPEDSQANAQVQQAAEQDQAGAAKFISQNPAYAAGSVAGPALLTAGVAKIAPMIGDAIPRNSPLGDMVTKPRGTVPAEFASPAELKAYADENGIPFNAAQATEHNFPRNLQSVGERATVGGTAIKQQIKAAQAAVVDHAQELMSQLSPNTPDLATAGERIQRGIAAALDREMQTAQRAYSEIDDGANGVKVDLRPLKKAASSLLSDSDFIRQKISSLDPKRASLVVQGAQNLPETATFTQAQQLRSSLLEEARHPDIVISQQGQGWIKKLSGMADQQMEKAAASTPELMGKFRAANGHWKGIQEAFNSPRSPLYQALQEVDPNKIPQKFISQGQIGGSPYSAELFDRYGIDKAPIKWALMGDMIKKDFGLYSGGKTLAGYSDPFLESMFAPAELESIYKTGAIARSLKLNTNTSGTGVVEGAQEDVQRPIKSLLPKALAAKLTKSQSFNDWLVNNPAPPSSDIRSFSKWLNDRHAMMIAASLAARGNAGGEGREKEE